MPKTRKTTKRGTTGGRKSRHDKGHLVKSSASRRGSRSATGQPRTKAAQILALLKRPAGVTLNSIMVTSGWQAHSVRGFISGHLVKKMKFRVKSFRRDGERVYAIES